MGRLIAGRRGFAGTGIRKAQTLLAAAFALAAWVMAVGNADADFQPVDLAAAPMFSSILAPPANIMILLDDSGSMTWEILVEGKTGGLIPKPFSSTAGYAFVFDNPGNSLNVSNADWDYLGADGRKIWKSQYYRTNVLYYNPNIVYSPWPGYGSISFSNADPDKPRVHPVRYSTTTLKLNDTSFQIGDDKIPHSHYFEWSQLDGAPYLVVINGQGKTIDYYRFAATAQGDPLNEKITQLTPITQPPADVVTGRSYDEERQNFANWFSYYRRREFVAKASLAQVLLTMESVRVGIYGINQKVVLPLSPVKVINNGLLEDGVDTLLDDLYDYVSSGGTPLNKGLNTIGEYYRKNDGNIGGKSGAAPYGSATEGGSCQQSFTIAVTDGYYTDPHEVHKGNTDGIDSDPYTQWGGGAHPYADSHADTLADIAMYYYANDLQTGLDDKLPVNSSDKARHQHMVTFGVAFGVNGSLDPHDYDADYYDANLNPIQWPAVTAGQTPETIDDLWHATVNGRGRFFSAKNPVELADSLVEIMKAIVEIGKGSSASVAVNGDWLFGKLGPNTYVYQPTFSNKDDEWTGDVKAYELDPVTGSVLSGSEKWSAAARLASKTWNQRVIATYNGGGVAFEAAYLSSHQKTQLGPHPTEMVQYLRGLEIQGYRPRNSKLGDVVNARPVFIDDFLYVGGNDGMLHAFDAGTGDERFAYVPGLVFPNLKELADPAYAHRFFVDLTPTVKKAVGIFGGANTDTLLVGGLRGGGKGYFAIDIGDAATIVSDSGLAGRVKWEYPVAADADMGFSYSIPTIVKSNSTAHPWVVVFGNGYNSLNGSAVLYILDAADGTLIRKIDTLAIPANNAPANGLSTPVAIDVTYDQKADFVYAGDLYGNLWKFDLRLPDPANWSVAYGNAADPKPLFQAKGPNGQAQPITTKPDVMYHPKAHGLMVCFGTGRFLGNSDIGDTEVQTLYGIWDYGDTIYDINSGSWSTDDNTEYLGAFDRSTGSLSNQPGSVGLLEQTFQDYAVTLAGTPRTFRVFSEATPVWITAPDANGQADNLSGSVANHAGYYIDLTPGERIVSDVLIRSGILIAIGYKPENDRCGLGGRSMLMELNVFTGGNLSLVQFDINNDNVINHSDKIDIDTNPGSTHWAVPSGILMEGHKQLPAFLRLDNSRERLYLSGSGSGGGDDDDDDGIDQPVQRSPKLGVTYWMQIFE